MQRRIFPAGNIALRDFLKTFEETTGLAVCLYDFKERSEGSKALSVDSSSFLHKSPYCAFVKSTKPSYAACFRTDHDGLGAAEISGKPFVKKCHAGLDEIVLPVISRGKYLGCILAGQVFFSAPSEAGKRRIMARLKSLGLDSKKAAKHIEKVRVVSKKGLSNASNMLKLLVHFIIDAESKEAWEKELTSLRAGMRSGKAGVLAAGVANLRNARMKNIIDASVKWLEASPPENVTLGFAAKSAGLSKYYYTRMFKTHKGLSFRDYQNTLKIKRAGALMKDPGLNLSEIAYRCGYRDLSSFSRAFFRKTGSYPGVYRKVNFS